MGTPWVSFDGKDCGGCKHLNERGYCEFTGCIIPRTVRATIPDVKPQTNADRIRAMTDEELASILAQGCHETRDCPTMLSELFPYDEAVESCEKCWLDWLMQEALP